MLVAEHSRGKLVCCLHGVSTQAAQLRASHHLSHFENTVFSHFLNHYIHHKQAWFSKMLKPMLLIISCNIWKMSFCEHFFTFIYIILKLINFSYRSFRFTTKLNTIYRQCPYRLCPHTGITSLLMGIP